MMRALLKSSALIIVVLFSLKAYSQSEIKVTNPGVSINDNGENTPASTAILDVNSNNKGVVFPRLTTAERDAILNPEPGLLIFNKDIYVYQYWNNQVWLSMGIQIPVAPETPADFKAIPTGNQIVLSWTDNSTVEQGFVIERSIDDTNFEELVTTPANETSYVDIPEANGFYYYRLKAINETESSEYVTTGRVLFIDFTGWYAELTTRFAPDQFIFADDPNTSFATSQWTDHIGDNHFVYDELIDMGKTYWEGNDITRSYLYNGHTVFKPQKNEAMTKNQWNFLHDGTSDYTIFMAFDLRGNESNYRIRPLLSGGDGPNGIAILLDGAWNGRDDQFRIFQGVPATEVITSPDQKVKFGFNVYCLRLNVTTNEIDIFVKHQEIDKEKFTGTADLNAGDSSAKLRLEYGEENFYLEFLAKKSAMSDSEVHTLMDLIFDYYNN